MSRPVNKDVLLNELPPYTDAWVKVKDKQEVPDIMSLILKRHYDFAADYDQIGPYFIGRNLEDTCNRLYDFCRDNIQYQEETEDFQSVGNPSSILARGAGDCKHYACFIGGCLDAIERETGNKIDWCYSFVSYLLEQRIPYHVFIIVNTPDGPLYVDPTPGAHSKEPIWMDNRKAHYPGKSLTGVNANGILSKIGATSTPPVYGTLIPPPHWYPASLPRFYRDSNNAIVLRPLNAVPNFTPENVLDTLLYLQTIIGFNRTDSSNAITAAWTYQDGSASGWKWVEAAFKANASGNGGGNFADVSPNGRRIDEALYQKMQARYISNEAAAMPWLVQMQKKGQGIDLMTIPMSTDLEVPRPSWYPQSLPSLFKSSGQPFQYKNGHLDTKPKIRAYASTPADIAALMLYAQPVIINGPTPYPVNWYLNDVVNGAMAFYFKISLYFKSPHTDSEEQAFGITGDMMSHPNLTADPYASDFSRAMELIIKSVFTYTPGVAQVYKGAMGLAAAGGSGITGGPSPAGVFSSQVYSEADRIAAALKKASTQTTYLIIGAIALGVLGWYYWPKLKKAV